MSQIGEIRWLSAGNERRMKLLARLDLMAKFSRCTTYCDVAPTSSGSTDEDLNDGISGLRVVCYWFIQLSRTSSPHITLFV